MHHALKKRNLCAYRSDGNTVAPTELWHRALEGVTRRGGGAQDRLPAYLPSTCSCKGESPFKA